MVVSGFTETEYEKCCESNYVIFTLSAFPYEYFCWSHFTYLPKFLFQNNYKIIFNSE